jgi:outer membrane protein OmpA-like peptidoglycan-associated protein
MSGNNSSLAGIVMLALVGLGLLIVRRKSAIISALCVILLSGIAYASPKLPAPKFQPANTPSDYFQTRQADVIPHLKFSTGAMFSFERRPLELLYDHNGEPITDIIQHRYNLDLLFAIGLLDRFEFGLAVPFAIGQVTKGLNYLGENKTESLDGGIGDLRFYPKMKLWKGDYFGLGLVAPFTAPTASPGDLFGENGPTFSPAALFDFNTTYFGAAVNVGYRFRENQTIQFRSQEIVIDDELFGSMGMRITLLKDKIDLLGDAFFSMATEEQDEEEVPVEILGGLRLHLPYGLTASVGAGAGLTRGAGAPTYRVLGGISWSPPKEKVRKVFVAVKSPPKIIRTKCPKCWECPPAVVCTKCGEVVIPPVFFDFDKDYLTATSVPVMLKVVEMVKKNPSIKKIVLHGHTDSKGSVKYNKGLSIRRVEHVYRFLHKNGLDVRVNKIYAWSENKPYTSNKTKDGRAQNRRVEFEIVR